MSRLPRPHLPSSLPRPRLRRPHLPSRLQRSRLPSRRPRPRLPTGRPRFPPDRRRAAALAPIGLVALVVVLVVVLVLLLSGGGSSQAGPATGAAAIVPADALAYVHVSVDSNRPAVQQALSLAARFPDYPVISATVQTRLGAIVSGSGSARFAQQVKPWLGSEAALALLNTPTSTAGSLIVLDVRDRRGAQAFVTRAGAAAAGSYRGTTLLRYSSSGTELAFVSHYMVLGQDSSVRAAIDVASGHAPSLQRNPVYVRAAAGEPADRVLDAYASGAGVRRLLAPQRGIVGALGVLLYQPALDGVTLSLSAAPGGARLRVHSAFDPSLLAVNGPRSTPFTPTLQSAAPSGSILMLDLSGLDRIAPHVLGAGAAAGLAAQIGPLLHRLGQQLGSEGVDVRQFVSLFHGETAVAITPSRGHAPSLSIIARTSDETGAREQLAALQAPLAQAFQRTAAGEGQVPVFNDRQIGAVTAHQLSLAPGLELDYAVSNGLVVISTNLDAVAAVLAHTRSLTGDAGYRAPLPGSPPRVTSLLFLDFTQLLSLGEQTGLTRGARYRALRADLFKVRAVGLQSTHGEADSTAELFLQIP